MLCILALSIFSMANSVIVLTNEESEGKYFKRSIERLAKIITHNNDCPSNISPSSGRFYEMEFYADLYSESLRYNISRAQYARTCYDAYIEMKLSPAESDLEQISSNLQSVEIMKHHFNDSFIKNHQLEDFAPIIYLAYSSRISFWNELASNAPLELQEFAKNVENKTKEAVQALIVNEEVWEILYVPRRPVLEWLFTQRIPAKVDRTTEERVQLLLSHRIVTQFVREVAIEYKKLSTASKVDVERHFCLHNVFRWLNSDWSGVLNDLYRLFWNVVGVNVDHLIRNNPYLSQYPVQNVTEKFVKKAEEIHMPVQEYVDLCAEVYAVMNLTSEERRGISMEDGEILVSKNWGSQAYDKNDEFEQALLEEGAPFIQTFSKRWDYVEMKLQQYELKSGSYLKLLKDHIWSVVRDMNNRRSWNGTRKIKFNSEGMFHMERFIKLNEYLGRRELEQFFCFESTVESVLGRAINFDEFELNREL